MAAMEQTKVGIVKQWRISAAECKQKWSDEVKVTQPKQGAEGFPFPMAVSRTVQRPAQASAWEVWELKTKVIFNKKPAEGEDPDITFEVATDGVLPTEVADSMIALILKRWNKLLKKSDRDVNSFPLDALFTWIEASYVDLLSSVPVFVSRFIAEGATGGNEWRFCLLEPTAPEKKAALTEEEKAAAAAAEIEFFRKQKEREEQALIEREKWAEERRREQEENGGKPRILSKKEQEELASAKRGQGNRTAKTGARRHKFDPEAAAEREKAK